jgi:hypothetical protein
MSRAPALCDDAHRLTHAVVVISGRAAVRFTGIGVRANGIALVHFTPSLAGRSRTHRGALLGAAARVSCVRKIGKLLQYKTQHACLDPDISMVTCWGRMAFPPKWTTQQRPPTLRGQGVGVCDPQGAGGAMIAVPTGVRLFGLLSRKLGKGDCPSPEGWPPILAVCRTRGVPITPLRRAITIRLRQSIKLALLNFEWVKPRGG